MLINMTQNSIILSHWLTIMFGSTWRKLRVSVLCSFVSLVSQNLLSN